jgi:hypothetical protein
MKTAHEIYEQAWRLMSERRFSELESIADPSFALTLPGIPIATLRDAIEIATGWGQAFSNFGTRRVELKVIESSDGLNVAVFHQDQMSHDGDFIAPDGTKFPATNRTVTLSSTDIFTINEAGKMTEWVAMFDSGELAGQIQ